MRFYFFSFTFFLSKFRNFKKQKTGGKKNSLPPLSFFLFPRKKKSRSRAERVARFREKRARRSFTKTIRYESRRAYADVRPRFKGRFASKEEVLEMKAAAAAAAAAEAEAAAAGAVGVVAAAASFDAVTAAADTVAVPIAPAAAAVPNASNCDVVAAFELCAE